MRPIAPKKRTKLRLLLGKAYYTLRRSIFWYLHNGQYAKERQEKLLPSIAYTHKTPLLRRLRQVDMWLQYNKIENLKIALQKLDGLILKPAETFSYWRTIGKPTKRKGYKPGMVLFYGGFKPGVGGGLCQLSNLIYWMTLHTPLQVTERYRHSYDVFPDANRTQPFGSGATCVYNYRDLQIYNGTDQCFQLHVFMDEENLIGEWRCVEEPDRQYKVYEKSHWISHEYWGSYMRHNEIYREVYDSNGCMVADEFICENHALMMYSPLLDTENK